MYTSLITRITTGWNFMRALRLLLALFILGSAIMASDVLIIMGGSFLLLQSLLGLGCASGQCDTPNFKSAKSGKDEEVIFEEIKH